ncbi:mitochondrial inner membrane protease atp23, partial [Aspergillus brasiliensis]
MAESAWTIFPQRFFRIQFTAPTFPSLSFLGEMSTSETSNSGSQSGKQDTGFLPGDDTWTQWRNIFSILAGRMTDEGKEQFRVARDIRNEAADCKRCEDQRDYLLQF